MQEPTIYADMSPRQQKRVPSSAMHRLTYLVLPVVVLVLIAASMSWVQWASKRGLTLGYPTPRVHITSSASSSLLLNTTAQYSASSSGRDLTYVWDFGDGGSGFGPTVNHTYQSNGSFTVTVQVTDALHQTSTDTTSVRVAPPAPTASFSYSISYGYVYLDASGSQADQSTSIARYSWDFGDGNTDASGYSQETHYYYYTGTYQVTLVVTDATGQSSNPYTLTVAI